MPNNRDALNILWCSEVTSYGSFLTTMTNTVKTNNITLREGLKKTIYTSYSFKNFSLKVMAIFNTRYGRKYCSPMATIQSLNYLTPIV